MDKVRTVKASDLQTSDWYKRRIGTNVALVQTSDWDKQWTSANVEPVQTSDGYIYEENRRTLVEFEKGPLL